MHVLLDDKAAVIYGAGGSIGGAVARAFAREGARVFLAGRTPAKLDTVADEIRSTGGSAETDVVDALDEPSTPTSTRLRSGPVASMSPSTSSRSEMCRALRWPRCRSKTSLDR